MLYKDIVICVLYGDSIVCCMETVQCVIWRQCCVLYKDIVICVLYGDSIVCYMETVLCVV